MGTPLATSMCLYKQCHIAQSISQVGPCRALHCTGMQGSELQKTGSAEGDDEDEEDGEELAEDDEDGNAEEEGADLPESKSSTNKVQTRRQKALAEGKE